MFYDLNVPWDAKDVQLQHTLALLAELGYNVVALTHTLSGKLPADLTCPIPSILPFAPPQSLRILRRCTLILDNPAQNHRIPTLMSAYDILAIRPTDEKTLQQACSTLDCDLISLDLSLRYPFHFKHRTLATATARGVRFEICYGAGVGSWDPASRRNLISNATALIRATRGRGLVISSEARVPVACRAPWDVINLAVVWGLGQERGKEAVANEARAVVASAKLRRTSYRGVVDVVYGGEEPELANASHTGKKQDQKKRKMSENGGVKMDTGQGEPPQLSKRELKRRAKRARMEASESAAGPDSLRTHSGNQSSHDQSIP